ncbi:MAG: NUDIX hydrolase [Acetobacteraceae bacterium]
MALSMALGMAGALQARRPRARLGDCMGETATTRTRPIRLRHAASLIVVREGPGPAAVLMGIRAARHRFMPNRLVFPGGGVEHGDFSAPAARDVAPVTQAMLEKGARCALARALGIAAARELAEETGLSLGRPPALDGLSYLCRALTPTDLPIRYHARFLVAAAETLEGTLGGSGELEELAFYALDDPALAALPWITAQVLGELALWLRLSAPERALPRRTAIYRDRVRREE